MKIDRPTSKREPIPMTHLSLFSGIGGIDLAAEWAGFSTIGFVERDPFCQRILAKHWPEVPIHNDVTTFDATHLRGSVSLVSGGFPCQPHSLAGARKASADSRDLWGEFMRIVRESEPEWVLGENVRGLLSSEGGRFFGRVLRDLADAGYSVAWDCVSAADAGAPHRRERIFLVAHAQRGESKFRHGSNLLRRRSPEAEQIGMGGKPMANTKSKPRGVGDRDCEKDGRVWLAEPAVGRVADGVPHRVDRLRALGNAVVPQQVYPTLQAIANEIHSSSYVQEKK